MLSCCPGASLLLIHCSHFVADFRHVYTGKYTVFGHVIDGMDVLDRMEKVPTGESWLYGMISLPS